MITDSGAMSWMEPGMKMETISGGISKAFGRMFSGETIFQNRYTATNDGMIAFASSFPGNIKAVEVKPGQEIVVQKSSFLAGTSDIEMSVFFNKKFSFFPYLLYLCRLFWKFICKLLLQNKNLHAK